MFGAIAAIAGGILGASSSKKAAKTQSDASKYAADIDKQMFETSRADMEPWRDVGQNALHGLADLWGLDYAGSGKGAVGGTPGSSSVNTSSGTNSAGNTYDEALSAWDSDMAAYDSRMAMHNYWGGQASFGDTGTSSPTPVKPDPFIWRPEAGTQSSTSTAGTPGTPGMTTEQQQSGAMGKFFTSPNYEWRKEEQNRAVENSALARGTGKSGSTQKEMLRQSGEMASGEFWNYVNQLSSMAGVGQNTAAQMATASNNAANSIGSNMTAAGQARASGYTGQNDAIQNAMGNFYYSQQRPGSVFGGGGSSSPAPAGGGLSAIKNTMNYSGNAFNF